MFPTKRPASLTFRTPGRRRQDLPGWVAGVAAMGLLAVIFWLIRAANMP